MGAVDHVVIEEKSPLPVPENFRHEVLAPPGARLPERHLLRAAQLLGEPGEVRLVAVKVGIEVHGQKIVGPPEEP